MACEFTSPPCPALTIRVDLTAGSGQAADLALLPAGPGVFLIQDECGRTLTLGTSANLRRLLREKLQPPAEDAGPTRRMDLAAQARAIGVLPVGSSFEADWAWLQLARSAAGDIATTYRAAVDHWRGWFVHLDEQAQFPRLVKTSSLVSPQSSGGGGGGGGGGGTYLGPMPDKHAAQRYLELLQNAFDLCRYYHILIQTPHATACAYKEMGRCPAPCDGSVSMDHYRDQIRQAIDFARMPIESWRRQVEQAMKRSMDAGDEANAQRLQRMLHDTLPAAKPAFAHVDRLDRFRYLAVAPSEDSGFARLIWIDGGWIEPLADVALKPSESGMAEIVAEIGRRSREPSRFSYSSAQVENVGLVSHHLFVPPTRSRTSFLKLGEPITAARLRTALKCTAPAANAQTVTDQSIDILSPAEE